MPLVRTRSKTTQERRETATSTRDALPGRDAAIDALRAACLIVVVLLHSLMVGVQIGPEGALSTSVALSGQSWFAPATWLLQIMPLFFIAGGFASITQWRRMRERGATASDYIAARIRRLAVPALIMIATVGAVLCAAGLLGADPNLIGEASLRIGQPLWFLAVYFGATALVPAMTWAHERRPIVTLVALAAAVLLVDLLHAKAGIPIGYANLALVWPLMQQLGFAMADGAGAGWSRRRLSLGVMIPLVVLLALLGWGWSPDMIENLNPPTAAIALLGTAQFFGLLLVRARVDRVTNAPRIARLAERAGSVAMTVYLWHMPVILALVAMLWATGMPLPEPHSAAWWATRLPWLVMIALCVFPFASRFARFEARVLALLRAPRPGEATGRARAVLCVVFAIAGSLSALLGGVGSPSSWLAAVGLLLAAGALSAPGAFRDLWAQLAECALMKGSGSTGSPLTRSTRWRWAPNDWPVSPTRPASSPAWTRSPIW